MKWLVNPLWGKTINWRAGCGRSASPVRREGETNKPFLPTPILFCYLVTLPLTHEDAAGVSWIAAVKREQQIQGWEVKDINLWAAAWASAG